MNSTRYFFVSACLAMALFSTACTPSKEKIILEKQAPQNMLESFTRSESCQQASCITLNKESLGRVFLLLASGKTSGATPQWYDLKPLVVTFERSGKKVALLGQNYNSIYNEIQTSNLIQTFDLVSEDEKTLTFDWGEGLKSFVLQSSYDIDAVRGDNDNLTESSFASLRVMDSYVRNIHFDEKRIELEQLSKVSSEGLKQKDKNSMAVENREETIAMNIQIQSYNLSSEFLKKEYDKSRRVGFFVTRVAKGGYSQDHSVFITKWDISEAKGPIRVRISGSVPEQYLQAVQEGALYWNKVFGKNVLVVENGVPVDSSPQDRSITLRWISWLDSGAAYAIPQSDPLTGEILRAQVFMPSVFASIGSTDLVGVNDNSPVMVHGAVACDFTRRVADIAELAKEATDSQRLRLAQDSIRSTVAHELGHALGLRHNFAGSFSSKVTESQIRESAKTYGRNPQHPGLETSTSIMDYTTGIDDILVSAHLKQKALTYDKMAMDWAYSKGDEPLDESKSLYCTDDDIALASSEGLQIYGCERFDAGNNPFLAKLKVTQNGKDRFVSILFSSILNRLYPAETQEIADVDTVLKDTVKWSKVDLTSLSYVSKFLLDSTVNSSMVPAFASLDNVKSGNVLMSKFGMDRTFQAQRIKSIQELGGYSAVFNVLLRDANGQLNLDWLERQIKDLFASPYFIKGRTLSGRDYALTEVQQAKIFEFFMGLLNHNKKAVVIALKGVIPSGGEGKTDSQGRKISTYLAPNIMTEAQAQDLENLILEVSAAKVGQEEVKVGVDLAKTIRLDQPYLSADERVAFLGLLSTSAMKFDMGFRRALALQNQTNRVNEFLRQVSESYNLNAVPKDQWSSFADNLYRQGYLDTKAGFWLKNEIDILLALDKLN